MQLPNGLPSNLISTNGPEECAIIKFPLFKIQQEKFFRNNLSNQENFNINSYSIPQQQFAYTNSMNVNENLFYEGSAFYPQNTLPFQELANINGNLILQPQPTINYGITANENSFGEEISSASILQQQPANINVMTINENSFGEEISNASIPQQQSAITNFLNVIENIMYYLQDTLTYQKLAIINGNLFSQPQPTINDGITANEISFGEEVSSTSNQQQQPTINDGITANEISFGEEVSSTSNQQQQPTINDGITANEISFGEEVSSTSNQQQQPTINDGITANEISFGEEVSSTSNQQQSANTNANEISLCEGNTDCSQDLSFIQNFFDLDRASHPQQKSANTNIMNSNKNSISEDIKNSPKEEGVLIYQKCIKNNTIVSIPQQQSCDIISSMKSFSNSTSSEKIIVDDDNSNEPFLITNNDNYDNNNNNKDNNNEENDDNNNHDINSNNHNNIISNDRYQTLLTNQLNISSDHISKTLSNVQKIRKRHMINKSNKKSKINKIKESQSKKKSISFQRQNIRNEFLSNIEKVKLANAKFEQLKQRREMYKAKAKMIEETDKNKVNETKSPKKPKDSIKRMN